VVQLVELFPEPDDVIALEPEELGLRMLPVLASIRHPLPPLDPDRFFATTIGNNQAGYQGSYHKDRRVELTIALLEAWAWLEGQGLLVRDPRENASQNWRLSRRAHQLAEQADPLRAFSARRIPKDSLNPKIREDVWALYHRGKYDTAVFEAMKAFEVRVREVAGFTNADHGKDMIARAFNAKTGPLRDDAAEPSEREAMAALMTGAYGLYRNSYAHRNVDHNDADEAAEINMLANHLLRIVDAREAIKGQQP
jgi:uncharacterized protein (TIGR02391 family)